MSDWIVNHTPDTTCVPNGENIAFVKITTEVTDNKAISYKKVDFITIKELGEEESIQENKTLALSNSFEKFSELIGQKKRTHSNKRQKHLSRKRR